MILSATTGLDSCSKSSAPADFSINASPSSVTTVEGGTTDPVSLSIRPVNGFAGGALVSLTGLPPGATATGYLGPSSTPTTFPVELIAIQSSDDPNTAVNKAFSLTITAAYATPTGTFPLTLHATSGALSHDTTLTLIVGPAVQTSQQGTVLYLQSYANGHTARIGLDTAWGGAIVEVSMDGTNFVNQHDTRRGVQPALYHGADQYPAWGPGSLYGWDPVLAGDAYGRGSTVVQQTIASASLFTRTAPLQWWPDNFGGGGKMAIPADMTFEQTVTVAPGAPLAFAVHYRLIHNGSDTHYNSGQEFPAVYVNSTYTRFAYYSDSSPWTNAPVTATATVAIPTDPVPTAVYVPEQWGALIDGSDQGLAVYVPGQYPTENAWSFANTSGTGPLGNASVYMVPTVFATISPGAIFEGDVYLVPGDLSAARAAINVIHQSLPAADISAPLAHVDQPTANATLSGSVTISGWAFDNVALAGVSIYVDSVAMGNAVTGASRPDVANAYPHVAPANCGWSYALDTTKLANGPHTIVVHAIDTSNHEAINAPVPVTINN
jgi:Bacterial Ig domain